MRKTMTRMGLGLALVVGAAGAAAAQSTRPDTRPDSAQTKRGERGDRGMRGRGLGGPNGALLKGITLTWSDDGRRYAYTREGRVYVAQVGGGPAREVAGPDSAAKPNESDTTAAARTARANARFAASRWSPA